VPDLAHAVLDLLIDGESGVWHLANDGATSWLDLARRVADRAGLVCKHRSEADDAVVRVTALSTERGVLLPSLESGLSRYFSEREVDWTEAEHLMAAE
jgi:dTDP-4-dehydrorhamnose reductase